MKKLILINFAIILISCENNNLGNSYHYMTKDEAIDIGSRFGAIIYKSERKDVINDIKIFSDVIACNSNDEFIIAIQEPNKTIMINTLLSDMEFWNKHYLKTQKDSTIHLDYGEFRLKSISNLLEGKQEKDVNLIADSIFNREMFYRKIFKNKYNYYLIEKINDSIYGPFNKNEFEAIKSKKKVDLVF